MSWERDRPSLATGPSGPSDPRQRRKIHAAIRRAIKIAEQRGVPAIPIAEAGPYLDGMFDDPFERVNVIAAYDHLADLIVFNPDHSAWADMQLLFHEHPGLYATAHPHHIIRRELGHAAHYRFLGAEGRLALWDADLSAAQRAIARKISIRATWNAKEFVAEVYAGLWGRMKYDGAILALYDLLGGPRP
jgi:hypothetical protein